MENAREKNQKQTRAPLAGTLSGPIMAVFSTTKILAYIRSFRFSRRFFFFFFHLSHTRRVFQRFSSMSIAATRRQTARHY